jgi:hypothetical protein
MPKRKTQQDIYTSDKYTKKNSLQKPRPNFNRKEHDFAFKNIAKIFKK